jgi:23S rRNA (guanosine2251-2'-O)-methyltransferase
MRDHVSVHHPRKRPESTSGLWLYGLHAVRAALANKHRKIHRLVATERARALLSEDSTRRVPTEIVNAETIARFLPQGAVHQGAALLCEGLAKRDLEKAIGAPTDQRRVVVVLDQLSDPQNVGAILRTAAAFGATAVIVQDRHAPPESGALAKAASGALDLVPYVSVVNIARTLEQLAKLGFWRIALSGDGESALKDAVAEGDVALVLGSEGSGIRRLVRENCDAVASVPISERMESLNVASAAAIALYELRRK